MPRMPRKGGCISRNLPGFARSQALADREHDVARIVAPLALAPPAQLVGKIVRGLTGKRRIRGPDALALSAMAIGAGTDSSRRIPMRVKPAPPRGRLTGHLRHERHGLVVAGDRLALAHRQSARNPLHFGVPPPSVSIVSELPVDVARVKGGEPRCADAIAAAVEPVAGEAGVGCAGTAAAQRNHFAALREAIDRSGLD